MPVTSAAWGVNDSRRDAKRYHGLLLALEHAIGKIRRVEKEGYPDIDEVLDRLLPDLASALNSEKAFVAMLREDKGKGKKWFELTAVYPRKDLCSHRLEWSELLQKVIKDGRPRVIDPLEEQSRDPIPGLEIFDAKSALLVSMQAADHVRVIGVCNKIDPNLGPYLAADRMALESITELVAIGSRVGERRQCEQRAEQMKHLMEMSEALAKQTDLQASLQLIADAVYETMGYQMVAVCLRDPEDKVRLLASVGLTTDEKAKLGEVIGPWEEFSAPMQERFQVSRSYFISEEDYPWKDYRLPRIVRKLGSREPEEWHSGDLLRVPLLRTGGQELGVISVDDPSDRQRPDLDTVQMLELFANHAAAAIERSDLYNRLQSIVASAKAVSEGITRSPQEVYKQIAQRACEVVGADSAVIYPYEAETLRFDVADWTGYNLLEPSWRPTAKQRTGTGLAASVLQKGMVIVNDTSLSTEEGRKPLSEKSDFIKREKVTAFAGLRLQVGERPVGILYINFRDHPHYFTEDELAATQPFADQAALSIRIAQLYEQKRRALKAIAEADQEIVSNLELDEVLMRVVEQARATLDATSAILFPYDTRNDVLCMPVFSGTLKYPDFCDKPDTDGTALTRLRASNTPQFADDSSAHPIMAGEFVRREGIASSAGLPLVVADQTMGYLFVNYTEPHHFTDDEKQFFINLANHAALAIHSARLSEELRFQATIAGIAAWGMELSHDINHEVYQIRSRADWALRSEEVTDEVRMWLHEIDERAEALSVIPIPAQPIESMSERLAVPLDEALPKWVENYTVRRPEVKLRYDLQCGETRASISDWWLGRVMRHLVRNALEAMPGGGTLTIRSRVQQEGHVEVQVEDTGTGIAANALPDLFRLPRSSKGEGRGFGLIIARIAVEKHGGKIWLQETEQEEGTTFAFTLPLVAESLAQKPVTV